MPIVGVTVNREPASPSPAGASAVPEAGVRPCCGTPVGHAGEAGGASWTCMDGARSRHARGYDVLQWKATTCSRKASAVQTVRRYWKYY